MPKLLLCMLSLNIVLKVLSCEWSKNSLIRNKQVMVQVMTYDVTAPRYHLIQSSPRFFHRDSNSMEISFHSHLDSNTVIATKLCTWHDSCAVVACAKICCDLMASNGIMARQSLHRIWIAGKKPLVKWAPDLCRHMGSVNIHLNTKLDFYTKLLIFCI